jgi:hypothetical protein
MFPITIQIVKITRSYFRNAQWNQKIHSSNGNCDIHWRHWTQNNSFHYGLCWRTVF